MSFDKEVVHIGTVKSFFPDKGFGFIDCPATWGTFGRDVFLHGTEFEAAAAAGLHVGGPCSFYVHLNTQGQPQANRVQCLNGSQPGCGGATERPADMGSGQAGPEGEGISDVSLMKAGPFAGVVKSFNEPKGFGFIDCAETFAIFGHDIFVHKSEYTAAGLQVGSYCSFKVHLNNQRQPQANSVQVLSEAGEPTALLHLARGWRRPNVGLESTRTPAAFRRATAPEVRKPPASAGALGEDPCINVLKRFPTGEGLGLIESEATVGKPHAAPTGAVSLGEGPFVGVLQRFADGESHGRIESEATASFYTRGVTAPRPELEAANLKEGDICIFKLGCDELGAPRARDVKPYAMAALGEAVQASAALAERAAKRARVPEPGQDRQDNACGPFQGLFKCYNPSNGYGFIQSKEARDVFKKDILAHKSAVEGGEEPRVGAACSFWVHLNKLGQPQAKVVQLGANSEWGS